MVEFIQKHTNLWDNDNKAQKNRLSRFHSFYVVVVVVVAAAVVVVVLFQCDSNVKALDSDWGFIYF